MQISNSQGMKPSFGGTVKIKGEKPLEVPLYKDDIALSQMTNNLMRVGIDRAPGIVDSNGALHLQPGLLVSHNKKGDIVTFTIGPADKPVAEYVMRKSDKGETLPNMEDHVTIFEKAVKYIDKTIAIAREKSNFLAGVDPKSEDKVYSAIHRHTF